MFQKTLKYPTRRGQEKKIKYGARKLLEEISMFCENYPFHSRPTQIKHLAARPCETPASYSLTSTRTLTVVPTVREKTLVFSPNSLRVDKSINSATSPTSSWGRLWSGPSKTKATKTQHFSTKWSRKLWKTHPWASKINQANKKKGNSLRVP